MESYKKLCNESTKSCIDEIVSARTIMRINAKYEATKMETRCQKFWSWIHAFMRYFFISLYYYITPFLIIFFQIVLLYAAKLYTQYQKQSADLIDELLEGDFSSLGFGDTED